ncbi:hypothetical protein PTSG_08437 [Salpingoeca rosetta]|uniref:Katanin p80 subunit C-terminal domain-containing protein n=1 Tax=Salpingoeca rosetta (strain ATCC 50818 / BSB-021) TaxID=946362 RepID=F2UJP2_SALR5|nr:uncharacterized protein PTSG_08437 [Salpingoeca rosetta]EGD77341.1 hypothetical protein PTSG_08437 [Salpingoeca rosetta]|eukprot:XP_004990685.1 hypothetical protein PTSG_08437 [Salpingoeca rosetta]
MVVPKFCQPLLPHNDNDHSRQPTTKTTTTRRHTTTSSSRTSSSQSASPRTPSFSKSKFISHLNGGDERHRQPLRPSNNGAGPYAARPATGSSSSSASSASSASSVPPGPSAYKARKPASRAARRSAATTSVQEQEHVLRALSKALDEGHATVITALTARLVNVKAARVVVDQGLDAVLSTVVHVNDPALLVDVSAYIAEELRKPESREKTSLGACLEVLPLVELLIKKPFEEYISAGLRIVDAIVDAWKDDLRTAARQANAMNPKDVGSVNLQNVFLKLITIQTAVEKLAKRPDVSTHTLASALHTKLSALSS